MVATLPNRPMIATAGWKRPFLAVAEGEHDDGVMITVTGVRRQRVARVASPWRASSPIGQTARS